jgi:hypothetical protein
MTDTPVAQATTVKNPPRYNYEPKEYVPYISRIDKQLIDERVPHARWLCRCCSSFTNADYMVHEHVWKKANIHPKAGLVCVPCLSKRLEHVGHKLTINDFTNARINNTLHFAYQMGQASATLT